MTPLVTTGSYWLFFPYRYSKTCCTFYLKITTQLQKYKVHHLLVTLMAQPSTAFKISAKALTFKLVKPPTKPTINSVIADRASNKTKYQFITTPLYTTSYKLPNVV